MFHSVGLENHPWAWSHISEPIAIFESKIALLKKSGFHGVFWGELYDYTAGDLELPGNSILLTFDDGYLDNWVYVYPILKKYGMKGTIFVSPDFVDPSPELRQNMDDVMAGRCQPDDLVVAGFLSWPEMREMEASGLIDIQSHAMTHTWYFSGPQIVDYHRPHSITPNPWLFWNARPDRKPYYLSEDQQEFLPWGSPILQHHKSLEVRRYIPDEHALSKITDFVTAEGGSKYFDLEDWRPRLDDFVTAEFGSLNVPGRFESEDSQVKRFTDELKSSKRLIEKNLQKSVDFVCWPGGATNDLVQAIAQDVGFKSWTLSSRSALAKRNRPGTDPGNIKRLGTSNAIDVRGRRCGTAGARFQLWQILAHQGSTLHAILIRLFKLSRLVLTLGGTK